MPKSREVRPARPVSTARLLARAARLVNDLARARAGEGAVSDLRPAHAALLHHLDPDGTSQSELGRRLGVSKQAVHQLIAELEEGGVIERGPHPSDRRATLIRLTKKGRRAVGDGRDVFAVVDEELAALIGKRRVEALHDALAALDQVLGAREE